MNHMGFFMRVLKALLHSGCAMFIYVRIIYIYIYAVMGLKELCCCLVHGKEGSLLLAAN